MGIELVERNSIQFVSRAARILRCLESEPEGLSLGVIATRSNLPRSTVQRLVDALAVEQLLDIGKNGVRLASALMRLASHSHFDVTYSARAPLERLAQHTGETSALVYSSGIELIMLHAVVSSQELRVAPMVGSFLCVYGTAAGKICLSKMSDEQVTSLLGGVTEPLTSDTLSLPALLDDLRHIRQQGIAFDHEEHRQGIGSIAIGVETTQGFYSITVVGPSWRIRDQREPIILALKECQLSLNASSCSTD